jgi:hypothetical protein
MKPHNLKARPAAVYDFLQHTPPTDPKDGQFAGFDSIV